VNDEQAESKPEGEVPVLTHLDALGRARMVDVGGKDVTRRRAAARCRVTMHAETLQMILAGGMPKGDVLAAARLAGIMAVKRTAELIPLCHPLPLDSVEVGFRPAAGALEVEAVVSVSARTGAEMEALTAVAVAGLTVYDMCKAVDRGMSIDAVRLVTKSGGRSGDYRREGEEQWPHKL